MPTEHGYSEDRSVSIIKLEICGNGATKRAASKANRSRAELPSPHRDGQSGTPRNPDCPNRDPHNRRSPYEPAGISAVVPAGVSTLLPRRAYRPDTSFSGISSALARTGERSMLRPETPGLMTETVYISGLGSFFPGARISNDEMEDVLGRVHGQPSR